MRKLLPAIVMGVGAFLLTMALLMRFYAYPKLAVVPLDQNTTSVIQDDNAKFFDADNVKPGSGQLTTTARIIGNPAESEAASEESGQDLAVWEMGQISDNNGDNMPMAGSTSTVVFDRHTGQAVNCCGESENGQEVARSGQIVKFPFDTQKVDTYDWWDGNTGKAYPVKFEDAEEIQGLPVYRFTSEVPLTKYTEQELPSFLFDNVKAAGPVKADRYYQNKRTFWVEPVTGVVIDREEQQYQEFQVPGSKPLTALDTTSRFTQETVDTNVNDYKSKAFLLNGVKSTFPLVLGVLGVLLLLGGLLLSLLFGSRKDKGKNTPAPAPAPAAAPAGSLRGGPSGPEDTTVRRSDLHGNNG